MLYAMPATVISAFVDSITVYGLTIPDQRQPYKALVLVLIIAGIFTPYQAISVPLTQSWSQWTQLTDLLSFVWTLGVLSDYIGIVELVATHIACGISVYTLLFRTYYKTMSEKMVESTRLNEATPRRVYRRIIFPLSGSMFAVVLIYQFTQIWNNLLSMLMLISTESSLAVPAALILTGLGTLLERQDSALRIAGVSFVALPMLAMYISFGDEFVEGVAT